MIKVPILETTSPADMIEAIKRHRAAELEACREQYRIQASNYAACMNEYRRTASSAAILQAQAIKADVEKIRQRVIELEQTKTARTQ